MLYKPRPPYHYALELSAILHCHDATATSLTNSVCGQRECSDLYLGVRKCVLQQLQPPCRYHAVIRFCNLPLWWVQYLAKV
mmetsp:Transcript_59969/g.99544  ORF Transcript_59969/g.99544 Transcript_59969/m.99544 type:complete len:81 (-) Transcript_59969:133-375(-)